MSLLFYLPIPGAELVAKNPPRLTALMSPFRTVANGRPTVANGRPTCLYLAVNLECSKGAISWTQRLLLLLLPLRGRRTNPCRGQLAPARLPAPSRPRDGRSRLAPLLNADVH